MPETLQRTPEQQNPASPPEVEGPEKRVAFLDGNGVERTPHPDAIECYASPEIIEEVTSHFEGVERGIDEIEDGLRALESGQAQTEKHFNPLSDELLKKIKEKAKSQLPALTKKRDKVVHEEVTTGRVFKKTKTVPKTVEVEEPVQGFTSTTEGRDQQKAWHTVSDKANHRGEDIDLDDEAGLEKLEKYVADKLEILLISDERTPSEPQGIKLPLLAKKIKDAGLSEGEIDVLTWGDLESLVPEAAEWLNDARVLEESLVTRQQKHELTRLQFKLAQLSPNACETIARIYYSEQLIERLHGIKIRMNEVYNTLAPLLGEQEYHPEDSYMEDQRISIRGFFDRTPNANQILMHGTKFIPRIIESGALRPAGGKEDKNITLNTSRTNLPGVRGRQGVDGSRGVHWAGPNQSPYVTNSRLTEETLRRSIAEKLKVREDHPWVDDEVSKGGVGEALLAMRLGDIVKRTPFGGDPKASLKRNKGVNAEVRKQSKYGLVELTQRGWEMVQDREPINGPDDVTYIAGPHNPGVEGIYDYEYPLDELLIGIPEADPEKIPDLLREGGWSEEMIATHTFQYSGDKEGRVELQRRMHRSPKYPRTLVVPIAMETGLD